MSIDLLQVGPAWIVAGVLGAMIGSFLNVCILRWGAEPKQSVVTPRSRCPRCGKRLSWYENVPVISWLLLRARCRGCGEPISVQYPLIELATAVIWAFMAWRHGPTLEALRGAVFGTILLGIAMTDARAYIIPHEFSIGGTALAIAMAAWPDPSGALPAVQGALFGAGSVLLIGEMSELAVGQEAMGGGDCALMGMIGAFLGWESVLPVLMLGAGISTLLFLFSAIWTYKTSFAGSSVESRGFRWGMVAKLLTFGVVPMIAIVVAARFGVLGAALQVIFHGLIGAGIAYYASFLLPASAAFHSWARVTGLLGAAIGIAVGGGVSTPRITAGVALALAVLWFSRRLRTVQSPDTSEGLKAQGYLPFGVGLTIAAAVLEFSGAAPFVRQIVAQYGRFLGLG